jgi:F0F1-type ATP synthase epsilon subunit
LNQIEATASNVRKKRYLIFTGVVVVEPSAFCVIATAFSAGTSLLVV